MATYSANEYKCIGGFQRVGFGHDRIPFTMVSTHDARSISIIVTYK